MNSLDIFSDSPRYFIFQKETNKTNFGGVLTLFFSIIMILISFLYFLDFNDMNNYSIEYSHIMTSVLDKDIPKWNRNPVDNPNITFRIRLLNYDDQDLSENFLIQDLKTKQFLDRIENNTYIDRRISDFSIGIFYNCTDKINCSLMKEDKSKLGYKVQIDYESKKIDPQNSPEPFTGDIILNRIEEPFFYKNLYFKALGWEVINQLYLIDFLIKVKNIHLGIFLIIFQLLLKKK